VTQLKSLRMMIPVSLSLLLAACGGTKVAGSGDSSDGVASSMAKSAVGAVVGASTGLGVSTNDLPPFAALPPGAKAIHKMVMNQNDKLGGNLSAESGQSVEALIAYFKESMATHGLKLIVEAMQNDGAMLVGQSEDQSKWLQVVLGKNDDGKSYINLVHTRAKQ
jgi:hypothetical protein